MIFLTKHAILLLGDSMELTYLIVTCLSGYFAHKVIRSTVNPAVTYAKLKRNLKQYKGSIINELPFIETETIEEKQKNILKDKFEILTPYVEKLQNYTSEENLKAVYRNLENLTLKKEQLHLKDSYGSYSTKDNRLTYRLNSALGHEFLHLASAYYDPVSGESHTGFYQWKGNMDDEEEIENSCAIGSGLTEGYTQLLAYRIYGDEIKVYKKETILSQLFELFFDDPKEMESYYFNHNLPGLIHHMEQYATKEEIIEIIQSIDKINVYSNYRHSRNIVPTYEFIRLQMKLYDIFRAKNPNSEKLKTFEEIICQNKIASIVFKRKKIKLQREFQKGTPIFSIEKEGEVSNTDLKPETNNQLITEWIEESFKKESKEEKVESKEVLEQLLPYKGMSFSEMCSEIFQVPKEEINILQATRLYCLMTNTEFPLHDRRQRYVLSTLVQTLTLPDSEKTPLEVRTGNKLQQKLDLIWENLIEENRDETPKRKIV